MFTMTKRQLTLTSFFSETESDHSTAATASGKKAHDDDSISNDSDM